MVNLLKPLTNMVKHQFRKAQFRTCKFCRSVTSFGRSHTTATVIEAPFCCKSESNVTQNVYKIIIEIQRTHRPFSRTDTLDTNRQTRTEKDEQQQKTQIVIMNVYKLLTCISLVIRSLRPLPFIT